MNTDAIAGFINEYYGNHYGKIAAESFKKNPNKYKILTTENGLLIYNDKLSHASIKILAGKKTIIKKLLNTVTLDKRILDINVPEGMNEYIETLKETGFSIQNKNYSTELKEYLLKMTYSGNEL